jgi:ferric-dicitrate binding protein FerR (iron transport regulator)
MKEDNPLYTDENYIDKFLDAVQMAEMWEANKPEAPPGRIEALWERINASRNACDREKKQACRKRLYKCVAAAACLVLLISFSFYFAGREEVKPKDTDYAPYKVINRQQAPSDIVIIAEDSHVKIEDENSKISYDRKGTLRVDDKIVKPAHAENPSMNQLCVPFGKRAQLTLSDGSELWVNTGTTVMYPSVFSGSRREIYVDGEVYASVAPDASWPFIVKSDSLEIVVHGTGFNLSAYKKDNMQQVVLVNGSVKVTSSGNTVQMYPNQVYTCTAQESSLKTIHDTEPYTSWRDGVYVFENETIENVFFKLSRYYNVTMVIPEKTSGIVCYGKLELKEDLSVLLSGLMQVASFNFVVKDNQYIIQFR